MAFFNDCPFYDVSWLVPGMLVREWESFCPNQLPASVLERQQDDVWKMAPPWESFFDWDLSLHFDRSWPGARKSYALRSSHFSARSQFDPSSWPSLWLELPLTEDFTAPLLKWLASSECRISRLIIAYPSTPLSWSPQDPASQCLDIISSILSILTSESQIRHLVFYNCPLSSEVHWPLLLQMLTSPNCPLRSIAFAHLLDVDNLVNIMQHSSCVPLSELLIHKVPDLSESGSCKRLLQTLYSQNSSVKHLSLSSCRLKDTDMEDICNLLRSPHCKVTALNLSDNFFTRDGLQCLKNALLHSYAAANSLPASLQRLSFCGLPFHVSHKEVNMAMAEVLEAPGCKLTALDLTGSYADSEWVTRLSQILQADKCQLDSLYLFHFSYMGISLSGKLLDGLKVNKGIIKLYFPWATEEYKQIADNVVQRNMSLQDAGLIDAPLVRSKCVKLLICGHERVGKTTLRKKLIDPSLMHFAGSQILRAIKDQPPTQGMNVSILSLPHKKSVVVCDLAGQREYHVFHHFFMSSSNQDLFAVVCKYDALDIHHDDPSYGLQESLEYWLKFVVSHRARTHPKPMVILVVNFFRCHMSAEKMARMARLATNSAVQRFSDLLDFGENLSNVFGVDLSSLRPSTNCISPLLRKVDVLASALMSKRLPIFKICEYISSAIFNSRRSSPVIKESFFCSVHEKLPTVMTVQNLLEVLEEYLGSQLFDTDFLRLNEVLEAALVELHNMGWIVFFRLDVGTMDTARRNQIVILDPVWFYETLIGSVVHPLIRSATHVGRKAHLHGELEESIVKEHIIKKGLCEEQFASSMIDYLAKLEFFVVLSSQGVDKILLFPSMLSSDRGNEQFISWSSQYSPSMCFYGRRLVCEDSERSMLPWAVFVRLQVQLYAVYGQSHHNFDVGYDWIIFRKNQVEALIRFVGATENWEDDHWIDVMVRLPAESSGQDFLAAEEIIGKVKDKVFQICNMGCWKVSLEERVLTRPWEKNPDLLCELKEKINMERLEGNELMKALQHLYLPGEIQDLLNEMADAERMVREEFELHKGVDAMQISKAGAAPTNDRLSFMLDFGSIKAGIREMEELWRRTMEEKKRVMSRLHEELSGKLLNEKEESAHASSKLPLFPLLEDEAGRWSKLKGMFNKDARLHVMCESAQGCHRVEKQKGIVVTVLTSERLAKVVEVLIPAFKILYGVAKIAASFNMPGGPEIIEGVWELLGVKDMRPMRLHKATFPQLLGDFLEGLPTTSSSVQQNLVRLLYMQGLPPHTLLREFYSYVLEGREQDVDMRRDFSLSLARLHDHPSSTSWLCEAHITHRHDILPISNPFSSLIS